MSVEAEIKIENAEEVKAALSNFDLELEYRLGTSLERTVQMLEKEFKGTTGFRDVTGKLRKSLFVVTIFNPVGIAFGSFLPYAAYVAFPHGTWMPAWFQEFIVRAYEEVGRVYDRVLKKLCRDRSSQ